MSPVNEIFLETENGLSVFEESVMLYERLEITNAHIVEVNGVEMSYLEFGGIDGIPLIWSHGSGSTKYELLNVQSGLVDLGYRVIAIDYRGHGKTKMEVNESSTSIYHIADDIAALMSYLAIPKAIIGGLSKGGWIASAFYDAYPDKVLGLLLEDGGSFSSLRLNEAVQQGILEIGQPPYPIDAVRKLFDPSSRFQSRLEGVNAAMEAYYPAVDIEITVEYLVWLLSLIHQDMDGTWVHHCDVINLMLGDNRGSFKTLDTSNTIYSQLPLMQQSQELMIPLVIFRNLHVPMHIIDPDSPDDWLPVHYQNQELQAMHPDLIVHEVYEYEHSPHEAHFERPERFISSASALLDRVRNFS